MPRPRPQTFGNKSALSVCDGPSPIREWPIVFDDDTTMLERLEGILLIIGCEFGGEHNESKCAKETV